MTNLPINMDIITLATAALSIAQPFLSKIGEGTSRKIGEDIWNLIKKPFDGKGKDLEKIDLDGQKVVLIEELEKNAAFKEELQKFVEAHHSQVNVQQNIHNNGNIDKQVNMGNMTGDINF